MKIKIRETTDNIGYVNKEVNNLNYYGIQIIQVVKYIVVYVEG